MTGTTLHQLGSRLLRALTPVALSVSVAVAGCETGPEPEAAYEPLELRASAEGPSAKMIKHGDAIAKALVADEAFAEYVNVSAQVMGDLHQVQQKLSPEDLEAIAVTTTQPYFAEVMGPEALLEHLGTDPGHFEAMEVLLEELREKHGLQGASPQDIQYVFTLAFESEEAKALLGDAAQDELVLSLYDPCEQACHNAYVATAMVALALFAIAMAVAVVTFPFGLLLAQVAIAMLNRTLAEAQAARDVCLAACNGVVLDIDLCGDADICDDDEYCWKGPFGIGADECRPKKPEGKTCTSDDHCESGCCKLHVWTNPVSATCRPASKCN